jgi:hypothetical protein
VIIRWLRIGKPGMFLIRAPEDAVVSWAIYWNGYLEESLDYYLDYHQALRPFAFEMFVVSFEVTRSQLGREIERFNKKFGTNYASLEHNGELVSDCFLRIEETSRVARKGGNGAVNELTVCRPSAYCAPMKTTMVQQLHKSPVLRRKLEKANELYRAFVPVPASGSNQRPSEP